MIDEMLEKEASIHLADNISYRAEIELMEWCRKKKKWAFRFGYSWNGAETKRQAFLKELKYCGKKI